MRIRPVATVVLAGALLLAGATLLSAHDMFIKLDSYFMAAGDTLRVPILNGTFTKSENAIERTRVSAVAVVDSGRVAHPEPLDWRAQGDTTVFGLILKHEGTYVVGVATHPSTITLKAADFNAYLKEEGLTSILERRKRLGQLNAPAKERYAKNVKAVFQVGEAHTADVGVPLGFPAEIIPLDNPYVGQRSGAIRVQCLVAGHPATGITVFAGSQRGFEKPVEKRYTPDAEGIVRLKITHSGRWYVKFERMVPSSAKGIDYESEWATLTFGVR
jgi:uncharacterized protein DUF4198